MKIIIRENQLDLLNNGIITYHGGKYKLTNKNIKGELLQIRNRPCGTLKERMGG